ncbi:MAG: YkgJ family cysteine cluster protein [Thermoanaerobaculia bacterium]|nr:YkgJ family cysteine cluster protein [Thermoanaerobaculia bacterium]
MTIPTKLPTLPSGPDPGEVCPPCGKCCRYVSVGIDGPTNVRDVSTALWLVYHRNVSVYQSHEGDWFALFAADCENLAPGGLCGVYENRPLICREYDVVGCEGTSDEAPEKVRFDDGASLGAWLREKRPALFARCLAAGIIPEALRGDAAVPKAGRRRRRRPA